MATWIRQGTGTAPSATDADLVGEYSLDNSTAPADFDPAAVNSVRIQSTITGSGFSDDSWSDNAGSALVTAANVELAQVAGTGSTGLQNTSVNDDHTDSTGIPTGQTTAAWEGARLRGDGTVIPNEWCTWVKNKGPDGSTLAVSAVTVTIDYTPVATSTFDQVGFRFRNDDGSETAATWMAAENTDASVPLDTIFRLRFVLDETAGAADTEGFELEYRRNGGAWTTASSGGTLLQTTSSTFVTNQEATTRQLTSGTGSFSAGQIAEDPNAAGISIGAGNVTEIEWVIRANSAGGATAGDTIDFRVYKFNDATFNYVVLDAYTVADATATLTAGAVELEGASDGVATVTSALSNIGIDQLAGTPAGTSTVTAALTNFGISELAATTAGTSTVTATLTIIGINELDATLAGTGTVTAALSAFEVQTAFIGFAVTGPPYDIP